MTWTHAISKTGRSHTIWAVRYDIWG